MTTQTKTTGQESLLTDLNHGIMQHPLTIPEEGWTVGAVNGRGRAIKGQV